MAISKVVYDGTTLVDLTADTVTAATLTEGATAHDAAGNAITGTYAAPVTSVNGKTGAVEIGISDIANLSSRLDTADSAAATAQSTADAAVKAVNGTAPDSSGNVDVAISTADVLEAVYPVGSIYMSVNATSPASLFGGTWERIKDTFLLAAGEAYAAGAAGGEATHTLTTDELPNIYGSLNVRTFRGGSNLIGVSNAGNLVSYTSKGGELWAYGVSGGETTTKGDLLSFSVGGDAAHNNMPPYLAVYMWQRTA